MGAGSYGIQKPNEHTGQLVARQANVLHVIHSS